MRGWVSLTFVRESYDRLVALAVLVLLVSFSICLMFQVHNLQGQFRQPTMPQVKESVLKLPDLAMLETSIAMLKTPPLWDTNENHRVFISHWMKVRPGEEKPSLYDETADGDKFFEGIQVKWLRRHHFALVKGTAEMDPDHDGFTNLEEYEAHTDPNDPSSRPDAATKLRIIQVDPVPFPFRFNGVQETAKGTIFSLARLDGARTYFVQKEEMIDDHDFPGYRVVQFIEKHEKQPDPWIKGFFRDMDVSELTLKKEREEPVRLVKEKKAYLNRCSAHLFFMIEKRQFVVGETQGFQLGTDHYQVVKIRMPPDGKPEVSVRNTGTDQCFALSPAAGSR